MTQMDYVNGKVDAVKYVDEKLAREEAAEKAKRSLSMRNGKKTLEFSADVFIVPNSPSKLSEVADFQRDDWNKLADSILNATAEYQIAKDSIRFRFTEDHSGRSNCKMKDDDLFLQVWISSKDLHTENLSDHGADVFDTDGREVHFWPCGNRPLSELPAKLFIGKKEGDIVDVVVPDYQLQHFIPKDSDEQPVIADVIMHLRLAQQEYRYRRFGTFDSLFKQLTGLYDTPKMAGNSCEAMAMEV